MHEPVLVKEVVDSLHIQNQAQYIDATLGSGGHTLEIIKRGGVVLGIEADESILEIARKRLEEVSKQACPGFFTLSLGNFRFIDQLARENGFSNVSGILFDLGISTLHYTHLKRGFSFQNPEEPLDMRLNTQSQSVKASDLLNGLRVDQLQGLLAEYLKPHDAKRVALKIKEYREQKPFENVGDLLEVTKILPKKGKTHPATEVFMALRISVNSELDNILEALPKALELLANGGKLVIITFHSTEDRFVKRELLEFEKKGLGEIITKKPITPSREELIKNPKSRSAKMRVFQKHTKI